jgi:hypothetical protein
LFWQQLPFELNERRQMTPLIHSNELFRPHPVKQFVRPLGLLSILLLLSHEFSAKANVYATNVKINGGFTNVSLTTPGSVQISYILNEPASGGVTVRVLSGSNAVRTISLSAGAAGTLRGTNSIIWDGTGNNFVPVGAGTYSVAITAAAVGYSSWTQITDDGTNGNNVWEGRGITVDQNTSSPYYGRVFVANSAPNDPGANDWLGYQVGILKCNADGSYADEGGFSTGGYPWTGDGTSPWHLEISSDDRLYVEDFATNGQVISWDPTVSPAIQKSVLRADNWTNLDVTLSGPALSGTPTNMVLWMADTAFGSTISPGSGILRYPLLTNGTCSMNDQGTTAVAVGGSLTGNPVDVAVDAAGNIYTIENITDPGGADNRVFRFPPFQVLGPITNATWAIGSDDDTMAGASGIAINPTGTYVAVAFAGLFTSTNGCTQILNTSNGAIVANLDLGVEISGYVTHSDVDCAWDAVGNVYYIDNYYAVWRTFSPPGTNQATTVALANIEVTGTTILTPPHITHITASASVVTIDFSAGTNDVAAAFALQSTPKVNTAFGPVTNATITPAGPGIFRASVPPSGPTQFYRIKR